MTRLNLKQTKIVGLTMELDLKVREYEILCNKLDKYKKEKIDENDEMLKELLEEFKQNNREIVEIKRQIKEIDKIEESNDEYNNQTVNYNNLFKEKVKYDSKENLELIEKKDKNVIEKIIDKIKKFFKG